MEVFGNTLVKIRCKVLAFVEKKIFFLKMDEFLRQWNQVQSAFGDLQGKFKRCGEHIVYMLPTAETKTNEGRTEVVDKRYAKFRANQLRVEKIYHIATDTWVNAIDHMFEDRLNCKFMEYKVREIAFPDGFEENLDAICAQGIHYFNSLFAAFCYGSSIGVVGIFDSGKVMVIKPYTSLEEDQKWLATYCNQFNVHVC